MPENRSPSSNKSFSYKSSFFGPKYSRSARSAAGMKQGLEKDGNRGGTRPRGRTQAERDAAAAAAAAAKLAAEKAAGQKRRKAFYKAKTTLLFNKDKKA